jgi:uncharacterized membrane protein YfcA
MIEQLIPMIAPVFEAHFSGFMFYAVLVLLGMGIGFLTGFFGVGGGFLSVPLLNIIMGIPYEIAVGSDLSFIIGNSSSGLLRQSKLGKVEYKAVGLIAIGSITGSVFGDMVQDFLVNTVAGGNREVFTSIMHGMFIVLLAATIYLVLRGPRESVSGKTVLQRFKFGPSVDLKHEGLEGTNLIGLIGIGFGVGILTGVMGIGGGVLIVPILLLLVGLPADKASGSSLGIILLAATAGVVKKTLAATPKISLPVTMALLVASVVGVQLGIHLVQNFDTSRFRRYFAYIVALAIVLIIVDLVFF